MGISENLKRGVTELVLLRLLSEEDMYGYDMAQALQTRSNGKFVLLESTMYPTLYRLQDNGFISAYQKPAGKRRMRTYYHLEPAGIEYFRHSLAEYLTAQEGIRSILDSGEKEGDNENAES